MNKATLPKHLRKGDVSGKFVLHSISEYKTETKGYVTTWITKKGLRVIFLKANDHVGIDYFGRYS